MSLYLKTADLGHARKRAGGTRPLPAAYYPDPTTKFNHQYVAHQQPATLPSRRRSPLV